MAADMLQGMGPSPQQGPSQDEMAAFEQLRQQISPGELNAEMMSVAEQVDPAAVAELKAELQSMEVPPEVIAMLRQLVQEVLSDPGNYPQIRQKYLSMGVDVELLPEGFDAQFFSALDMALDQMRVGPSTGAPMPEPLPMEQGMPAPEGFAKGGIASLRPVAREMAAAGRYGDTMLAHITPAEAQLLRRYGGSGSINPVTGLPEFFSLFKKIGKAIKKFASSTVGKIVTGIVLYATLGPLAAGAMGVTAPAATAAISGFVAGAGSTLMAGGNLKDALRTGAISGLTAGALKGVTGGKAAFQSAPAQTAAQPAIPPGIPAQMPEETLRSALPDLGTRAAEAAVSAPPAGIPEIVTTATPSALDKGIGAVLNNAGAAPPAVAGATVRPTQLQLPAEAPSIAPQPTPLPAPTEYWRPDDYLKADFATVSAAKPSFLEPIQRAGQSIWDKVSPSARSQAGYEKAMDQTTNYFGLSRADVVQALKTDNAISQYFNKAAPGMISNWAPLAAAGLGIAGLAGAFDEEQQTVPTGWEDFAAGFSPGAKLLAEQPGIYGLQFGGTRTTAAPYNPYTYSPPRRAAKGGSMETNFPRKNGHISGPGTGTSDDIPAMLSDGEFVFTAKAVRNMGNGSRRLGAKKMYALMKKLEGQKNG